jgi:TonB family protein
MAVVVGMAFARVHAASSGTGPAPADSGPDRAWVEILSSVPQQDQPGIIQHFLPALEKRTKEQWLKIMPLSAKAPLLKQGRTSIEFVVRADGAVRDMVLRQPSGDVALDRAAWAAITGSSPYASFPAGVTVPQIRLRFNFVYNEPEADDTRP